MPSKKKSQSRPLRGSAEVPGSPGIIDIARELSSLVVPLAGSTQGEAVKFVLMLLREQPALAARIRGLEENLRGWRTLAGHYCTCLGKEPRCKPCTLEVQFLALMANAELRDRHESATSPKQTNSPL